MNSTLLSHKIPCLALTSARVVAGTLIMAVLQQRERRHVNATHPILQRRPRETPLVQRRQSEDGLGRGG